VFIIRINVSNAPCGWCGTVPRVILQALGWTLLESTDPTDAILRFSTYKMYQLQVCTLSTHDISSHFQLALLFKMNNKQSFTTLPTLTPQTPTTRCSHDHAKQHFPLFLLACQSLQTYLMPRWIQQKRLNWSITSIRRPTTYQTTTIFFL
jgi:hypothetical protein